MTLNTQNNVTAIVSVVLLIATMIVSQFVGKEVEKDEPDSRVNAPAMQSTPTVLPSTVEEGCDVIVISVDVGDGPFLLWSNHKAKCNEDGTVTVETDCKGNSW